MQRTFSAKIAEFASSLRYEDLPKIVIEKAKICLLDFLGMTVAGYKMEVSQLAIQTTKLLSAPGSATILIDGHKGRAIDCVLANSVLAHSFLQDDGLLVSYSHPGVSVIPPILAIAEEGGHSGRDVLTAMVVGYEVEDRAGALGVHIFKRGFRAAGIFSYFGSASAAAKLMGLSSEQFKNALGCAGSMAGGLLQPWIDGSMEWAFEEAFGCRGGILAALLAQQGLRGADNILEGPCGINQCFAGTVEGQEETVKGLGVDFQHFLQTIFKPFPSGGVNEESIAMALDLVGRCKIDYRKIRAVRVKIPSSGTTERMDYPPVTLKGPFMSVDQCLISKLGGIAVGLKNGVFDIDTARREYNNPEVTKLTHKIHLEEIRGDLPLSMEIELEDGKLFHTDSSNIKDLQQDIYLNGNRAREKFMKMASAGLGMKRTKQIMDLVFRTEELDSIVPIIEQMIGLEGD